MDRTLASAARMLNSRRRRRGRARGLPPVVLVTDETRLPDPAAAIARLPRGSGVIFRHYRHAKRAEMARALAALCRRRGLVFIVAGDARLALAVRAQGLHLRERELGFMILPAARRLLITAAAHSRRALVAAGRRGADAALLGPVFATESHPGSPVLGPLRFALLAHKSPVPALALGGVTGANARRLLATGAAGLAALGALSPGIETSCGGIPAQESECARGPAALD